MFINKTVICTGHRISFSFTVIYVAATVVGSIMVDGELIPIGNDKLLDYLNKSP